MCVPGGRKGNYPVYILQFYSIVLGYYIPAVVPEGVHLKANSTSKYLKGSNNGINLLRLQLYGKRDSLV